MPVISFFDLFLLGALNAGMLILGFVVYFSDRLKLLNRVFIFLIFSIILFSDLTYIGVQWNDPVFSIWNWRLVIFSGVLFAYFFFLFTHIYRTSKNFSIWSRKLYITSLATLGVSLFTLTPFVFKSLEFVNGKTLPVISYGWGIPLFGLTVILLDVLGLYNLYRKIESAPRGKKNTELVIFAGFILMLGLIITFNFLLPVLVDNTSFIPLSILFPFPFLAFIGYTIAKHRFLDTKIVFSELLTFILSVFSLVDIIFAQDIYTIILRIVIFIAILVFCILLIRSVRREVKQREDLSRLTSELADTNEKLRVLDKARVEFISIASHQLRTPPATIKWYITALLGGDFGQVAEEIKTQMLKVKFVNDSQISLIDDLLNVSRIERGRLEFYFEKTDFIKLTKGIFDQLVPLAEMKHMGLHLELPPQSSLEIVCDKEKIRQVINNFIDNAIKYSGDGIIVVELMSDNNSVIIRVTDNGKGIAPETMEKLFRKYSRGNDSAAQSSGLGLGLYVAKVIVEEHGGKIWAESPGLGKGSSFCFSLPLKAPQEGKKVFDLAKN